MMAVMSFLTVRCDGSTACGAQGAAEDGAVTPTYLVPDGGAGCATQTAADRCIDGIVFMVGKRRSSGKTYQKTQNYGFRLHGSPP